MEEILAYTLVFELPHDIGVDHVGVFSFTENGPWDGWSSESMAGLIQYHRPLDAGRRPEFRVVLRRTRLRGQLPLQAADKAFSDWVHPLLTRWRRIRRRLAYLIASTIGLRKLITVAAVTAFLPTKDLPSDTGPHWTQERLSESLRVLNELLVTLGVVSQDPRFGPIYRSDLPARIPAIVESQPVPTAQRMGGDFMVPVHDVWPDVQRTDLPVQDLEDAAALFRAVREGGTVWFPVLELTHTARRDGQSGRYAASVLSATTGIEVMVSTVVREVGKARGLDEKKIEGILDSGFKNILQVHVPKLLRTTVDLSDPNTPWGEWHEHGYLVRNRVAHAGKQPTEAEANRAVYSAMAVVAEVGRIVETDPALHHLEFGLPTGVGSVH